MRTYLVESMIVIEVPHDLIIPSHLRESLGKQSCCS